MQESTQDPTSEPAKKPWDEGNWFALALGLGATFLWGPLLGFYMGTVFGHDYHAQVVTDLQHPDLINGAKGAFVGFIVGLLALIFILKVYPSRTEKDVEDWQDEFSHPHFKKSH